jgi:hypothetical protein
MNSLNYPLQQLITIKKNRYDQALKTLEEKKALLLEEESKLKKVEEERDKVLTHKNDKLLQLRQTLDEGTTTDKIQQMKSYLKVVDENLVGKQKKVADQQKNVKFAQDQVELAKQDLFQKQKDVEKMELHKKEWEKEVNYWVQQKEAAEQDELGATSDLLRKMEKKRKDKT